MFADEDSLQCLPDSRLCSPAHHYDPSRDVRAAADYYFVDYSSGLDAPFPCCLPGRRADSDWFGRPYQKLETCVMSFAVFPSASLEGRNRKCQSNGSMIDASGTQNVKAK